LILSPVAKISSTLPLAQLACGKERYSGVASTGVRSSGVQEFRSSGVQEFRSSGVQEFRSHWRLKKDCKSKG
jgi:hypothetical protein